MRWLIVVLALLTLGGCQTAHSVVPIALDPATLVPPSDPRLLITHYAAVRGIAAMLARELALPLPDRVPVYV